MHMIKVSLSFFFMVYFLDWDINIMTYSITQVLDVQHNDLVFVYIVNKGFPGGSDGK